MVQEQKNGDKRITPVATGSSMNSVRMMAPRFKEQVGGAGDLMMEGLLHVEKNTLDALRTSEGGIGKSLDRISTNAGAAKTSANAALTLAKESASKIDAAVSEAHKIKEGIPTAVNTAVLEQISAKVETDTGKDAVELKGKDLIVYILGEITSLRAAYRNLDEQKIAAVTELVEKMHTVLQTLVGPTLEVESARMLRDTALSSGPMEIVMAALREEGPAYIGAMTEVAGKIGQDNVVLILGDLVTDGTNLRTVIASENGITDLSTLDQKENASLKTSIESMVTALQKRASHCIDLVNRPKTGGKLPESV